MQPTRAFAVTLLLGLVVAACSTPAAAPSQSAAPTGTVAATAAPKPPLNVTVLVGTNVPVASLAPQTSIANVLGYWKEENLNVEVKTGVQGDAQVVQLLGTNQGTVGVIDPPTLMNAREKGVPLKAVYAYVRQPFNAIYVLDSSPLKAVADLKGKTLGSYSIAGGPLYESTYILKSVGLTLGKDVNFVNIGFDAATIDALKTGKADAYTVTEPDVLEQIGGLKFRKLDDPTSKDRFGFVWVFPEQFIKDNPAAVVGIMRGVAKATLFATTNPTAAVQVHWKAFPAAKPQNVDDATALTQAVNGVKGRYAKYALEDSGQKWGLLPNMDTRWKAMIDLAVGGGAITKAPDIASMWTTEFITQINTFDSAKIVDQAKNYKP